jgi:hypothetical protein
MELTLPSVWHPAHPLHSLPHVSSIASACQPKSPMNTPATLPRWPSTCWPVTRTTPFDGPGSWALPCTASVPSSCRSYGASPKKPPTRSAATFAPTLETMAKIGRNWRYVLNLAVHVRRLHRYHSIDAVALPANIHEFDEGHLAGRHGKHGRDNGGQDYEVWDYERSLARSETMHTDPTPSEHVLEECKELIEQASLSSYSPQRTKAAEMAEVQEQSPKQDAGRLALAPDAYYGARTTISTSAATTMVAV